MNHRMHNNVRSHCIAIVRLHKVDRHELILQQSRIDEKNSVTRKLYHNLNIFGTCSVFIFNIFFYLASIVQALAAAAVAVVVVPL